ncbi:MAG: DUF4174 domain-containing protein [Pseudomonadota bacterium]
MPLSRPPLLRAVIAAAAMFQTMLGLTPAAGTSRTLDDYKWEKRVLVIASERSADALVTQLDYFSGEEAAMSDRHMVVIQISDGRSIPLFGDDTAPPAGRMIEALEIDTAAPFTFLLIGKDGGVKLRETAPVPAQDIFDLIDAMPMRASEMGR